MSRRPVRRSRRETLGKDLLELLSVPFVELTGLLRLAAELKRKQRRGIVQQHLQGKMLGLLFQKPSTRTRVSFEAGMNQLGGQAMVMPMAAPTWRGGRRSTGWIRAIWEGSTRKALCT